MFVSTWTSNLETCKTTHPAAILWVLWHHTDCLYSDEAGVEFQRQSKSPLSQKSVRIPLDSLKLSKVSHKLNGGEFKDSRKLHPGESKWTLVGLYKVLLLPCQNRDDQCDVTVLTRKQESVLFIALVCDQGIVATYCALSGHAGV